MPIPAPRRRESRFERRRPATTLGHNDDGNDGDEGHCDSEDGDQEECEDDGYIWTMMMVMIMMIGEWQRGLYHTWATPPDLHLRPPLPTFSLANSTPSRLPPEKVGNVKRWE